MAGQINIENAEIGFRNFSGAEGQYNQRGDRNFVVFLDEGLAQQLDEDGWNIKWPKPNDDISPDQDTRSPYMQVSVSFDNFPPKVVQIVGENAMVLEEQDVAQLDWAEFENIDLVIRPYSWNVNGNTGIKAYLKTGYFTLVTDAFYDKYAEFEV